MRFSSRERLPFRFGWFVLGIFSLLHACGGIARRDGTEGVVDPNRNGDIDATGGSVLVFSGGSSGGPSAAGGGESVGSGGANPRLLDPATWDNESPYEFTMGATEWDDEGYMPLAHTRLLPSASCERIDEGACSATICPTQGHWHWDENAFEPDFVGVFPVADAEGRGTWLFPSGNGVFFPDTDGDFYLPLESGMVIVAQFGDLPGIEYTVPNPGWVDLRIPSSFDGTKDVELSWEPGPVGSEFVVTWGPSPLHVDLRCEFDGPAGAGMIPAKVLTAAEPGMSLHLNLVHEPRIVVLDTTVRLLLVNFLGTIPFVR